MRRVAHEQAAAATRPRRFELPPRRSLAADAIEWAAKLGAALSIAAAYLGLASLDFASRARRRRQQARVLPGIQRLAEAERKAKP